MVEETRKEPVPLTDLEVDLVVDVLDEVVEVGGRVEDDVDRVLEVVRRLVDDDVVVRLEGKGLVEEVERLEDVVGIEELVRLVEVGLVELVLLVEALELVALELERLVGDTLEVEAEVERDVVDVTAEDDEVLLVAEGVGVGVAVEERLLVVVTTVELVLELVDEPKMVTVGSACS